MIVGDADMPSRKLKNLSKINAIQVTKIPLLREIISRGVQPDPKMLFALIEMPLLAKRN